MYRIWLTLALSLSVVLGFPQPGSAQAQVKMYLKVDGITGSSADPGRQGWIDLQGYGQGVTLPSGASVASFQPLKVLKRIDGTSPLLFTDAAQGAVLATVLLEVARASDGAVFFTIKLENALVASVSSTSDPSDVPQELVTFNFQKIQWTAVTINPDGSNGGTTTGGWDLSQNKKV